jgi:TonB family protein
MNNLLFDHVWQSTLVLVLAGLLTLFFRNNGAHVRHALWTMASVKFLVPFALLNRVGLSLASVFGLTPPPISMVEILYAAGQPFSDGPVFRFLPSPGTYILAGTAIWGAGILVVAILWASRWRKLRATLRVARNADIVAPMPVRISPVLMEPGLVGIVRPVLLLPEGIAEKLTFAELQAVITHEACHLRRRDNLLAALHMLVETLFWFWPPVWWLGTRLIAERERACDEAVVASGNDPQVYATSILKVCKFYVQSPLACAAGVAGANLNQRMETIMEYRTVYPINGIKKTLLGAAATALMLIPVAAGLLWSPGAVAQSAACKLAPVLQSHTLPPYPAQSARDNETGVVEMRVRVAPNGQVNTVALARSSGHAQLDQAALTHVQQSWLWQPNNCGGAITPVRVVFALALPAGASQAVPSAPR